MISAADAACAPCSAQQEAIIARPDNRTFLAEIRCPSVIIVGAEDVLTPVKVAQKIHAGIAGSPVQVIADCGHPATLEQLEQVNCMLAEWLAAGIISPLRVSGYRLYTCEVAMHRLVKISAIYFDFITLLMLLDLSTYLIPELATLSFHARAGVALILSLLAWFVGFSLGEWLIEEIRGALYGPQPIRRVWINLIVGVIGYFDATKLLVRWTAWMPFMGIVPEGSQQIVLNLGLGAAIMIASVLVLRLHLAGKLAGVGLTLLLIASAVLSWSTYQEAIKRHFTAWFVVHGVPVPASEVESIVGFMQYYPLYLLACLAGMLTLLLFCYSKQQAESTST